MLTPEIFRPLYLAFVRPTLEYGLQASPPYLRRDVFMMERLQRLGSRMVKRLRGLSYEDRLRRFNLFTIDRRLQPISRTHERPFGRNFRGTSREVLPGARHSATPTPFPHDKEGSSILGTPSKALEQIAAKSGHSTICQSLQRLMDSNLASIFPHLQSSQTPQTTSFV